MSLTIQDVENLAETAKLKLTEDEKNELIKDMSGILNYLKQIEEVELPDIEAKYDNYNAWREDVPRDPQSQEFSLELITTQFPDSKDGYVKVKKIL
jgi:aspartyl-tRNA(Asn)/glutamyl-tRNA(Gln) amidotransferase subunit C